MHAPKDSCPPSLAGVPTAGAGLLPSTHVSANRNGGASRRCGYPVFSQAGWRVDGPPKAEFLLCVDFCKMKARAGNPTLSDLMVSALSPVLILCEAAGPRVDLCASTLARTISNLSHCFVFSVVPMRTLSCFLEHCSALFPCFNYAWLCSQTRVGRNSKETICVFVSVSILCAFDSRKQAVFGKVGSQWSCGNLCNPPTHHRGHHHLHLQAPPSGNGGLGAGTCARASKQMRVNMHGAHMLVFD